MIRVFNLYMHRQTLLQVLADFGLLVGVMVATFLAQVESLAGLAPAAIADP